MTRELERGLRAVFEDRADPVPAQEPDIADRVLVRAGHVRRRRAATAGLATAFVVIVLAIATVTGVLPGMRPSGPTDEAAGPQPTTTPSGNGIDALVLPKDGGRSFIRAADGTKIEPEDGRYVQQGARVPDGFLALTYFGGQRDGETPASTQRLSLYMPGRSPVTLAEDNNLVFSVSADGKRVAVMAPFVTPGQKPWLRVYSLPNGEQLGERAVPEGSDLGGWVGEDIVFGSKRVLQAWNPVSNAETTSGPDRQLQMFGTSKEDFGQTPMAKFAGDQMCIVGIDVRSSFKETTTPRCYAKTDMRVSPASVSPDGRWLVCVTLTLPGMGVAPLTIDLSRDLSPTDDHGSMLSLPPGYEMAGAVWTRDNLLLLVNSDGWWAYDPGDQSLERVSLPDGPVATPVPRYGS
ncbi:hypothetical protein Afil01_67340 [Actinorhabdospora filicis]|uniref:Uncharacterized protein n=1 Tax=Actinorhabdospora filicis TaxID=1785913 RepID=A0A9W6ST94_9ACTN|nr:hypothetical protein [Actinorhabdospora filicis]GLZ81927.1 hypothetical protein Afil01_67340 [Actinorhabdospora filicis]